MLAFKSCSQFVFQNVQSWFNYIVVVGYVLLGILDQLQPVLCMFLNVLCDVDKSLNRRHAPEFIVVLFLLLA